MTMCHLARPRPWPARRLFPSCTCALLLVVAHRAAPQSLTGGAIQGRVTDTSGVPIVGATVRITNVSNGHEWAVQTLSTGAYVLNAAGVGGPFRIEARGLGFAPMARMEAALSLGERLIADFMLRPLAAHLAAVEVVAPVEGTHGGTGLTNVVSRERITTHPNAGRDFLALLTLSPQTMISPPAGTANTGGITIGGQHRLYNSFRIDGGVHQDRYRGRLPGRETLPRPISFEALEAIEILAAPFDVRYGGFAGGMVNAVTRSGTNERMGSIFGYLSDGSMVGRGATRTPAGDFTTVQYGGRVSGPIVRDRAHLFLSFDMQRQAVPDPGPLLTRGTSSADIARIQLSHADALRFQSILRDSFGLDPGTLGPVDGRARSSDIFGKLSLQPGVNNHVQFSHQHVQGDRWGFVSRVPGFYFLSASSQRNPSAARSTRFIWSARPGNRWSNELIVSRQRLDDSCRPAATFPVIRVGPAGAGQLVAGAEGGCAIDPINAVTQTTIEVANNLSAAVGDHVLMAGVHGESLRFQDHGLQNASGIWTFATLDQLEAGRATGYQRTLPGPARAGGPDLRAHHLGIYVQDRWRLNRQASLTFGLRADVPIVTGASVANPTLKSAMGIDTGRLPGGVLFSPRLAIDYQLDTVRRTQLRGGMGVFTGWPPYMWLANAYRDDGTQELFLACAGTRAPTFALDSPPSTCADGSGPVPRVSYFDRGATVPQNLKLALGVDRLLPWGFAGSVDVLYTRAIHQLYATDANLSDPVGAARGEGNRPLFGTITGTVNSVVRAPSRPYPAFGQVVRMTDAAGDYALSLSVQMHRRFGEGSELSALYAFTKARDRMSLVNPAARANLENTPLEGTLDARPLRTSYFEIPHRFQLSAAMRLPYQASLSLVYAGAVGTPFTYGIEGDANADGIPSAQFSNDIVYVPRPTANDRDISLAVFDSVLRTNVPAPATEYQRLDAFIEAEPCLRRQRGRLIERNSCHNPWSGTVSGRLAKAFLIRDGQSVEVTADMYNLLNVLNARWGQSRRTVLDPWARMLTMVGYDPAAERGVYRLALPIRRRPLEVESRWRAELGARYNF